ncbi:multidrug effflux MFS transporter [Larsenimonas rhizosphaerae]|uniref:multidrug effflux MFS transporter n=1 Tax=Larsenimonas rhizosphaerae TaxID=2944682 RepID=UPI002033637A|nr:multidrug effflux MFS transporter [Larsenimonas rhizosphaerae]MCM2130541.1 multidrug effflux MFS transporter [Larsenimonas rhizosphaerae]
MHADMRKGWILLLIVLVMLTPMGVDIYLPSLAQMRLDMGGANAELQLTITLFIFTVGLGQLLAGPLTDRFGRRPWAILGCLLYTLGAVSGMLSSSLPLLYAGRIIQGIGACIGSVVAFSAVRDAFSPHQGARVYSLLNGALCIIPAVAPVLGGGLASLYGWRTTFAFMGLFALTGALACLRFMPETLPAEKRLTGPLYRFHRFLPMLLSARFLFLALLGALGMGGILVYVTAAPLLLMDELGFSRLAFGMIFGANALVNIAAFAGATRLIDRHGRNNTLRAGLAVALLAGIMFLVSWWGLAPSAWSFMVPVAVFTVGFSLALGSALSLALEPFSDRAGSASALFGCCQMSGGAALATLVTHLPFSPYLMMGTLCTAGLGAGLLVGRHRAIGVFP